MNKKLTFPELAELLSVATNTSKRMSELALREMFAVISGKLLEGESVKIDGLGVFKVTEVNSRRSVNVNTGEAIEIPGHSKITFVADKRLAEAVNAPFASFESVVLDDDVTADMLTAIDAELERDELRGMGDEEPAAETEPAAEEPVGVVSGESDQSDESDKSDELEQEPAAEVPERDELRGTGDEEPAEGPAAEEPTAEPLEVVLGESDQSDESDKSDKSDELEQEPAAEPERDELRGTGDEEPAEGPAADEAADEVEPTADEPTEEAEESNSNFIKTSRDDDYYYDDEEDESWWQRHRTLKGFLIGVVTGAALYAAAEFAIKYYEENREVVSAETIEADDNEVVAADTLPSDSVVEKALPKDSVKPAVSTPAKPAATKQVTDTITARNFLTRMARRHYGNGHFWVYIYEENRNTISNPNNVRPGTVVVIPDAKKYGIDKDDPQSVETAKRKEGEIQRKFL